VSWFWNRPATETSLLNAVYVWPACRGYFAEKAVPGRLDIRAKPTNLADEVSARLPAAVRSFLFHVDVTETSAFPHDRGRLIEVLRARSIRVLNADVTDISKRTVHAVAQQLGLPCARASRDGDRRELLIVKTDRNYGGCSERVLPRRYHRPLGLSDGSATIRSALDYKLVLRAEVPAPWWDDPSLVVERYITGRDRRLHRVYVVMDHVIFWSGFSSEPIKKTANCSDTCEHFLQEGEFSPALPSALLRTAYAFIEAFSLDYGALDLVTDDVGRFFVIDVNSTPWYGAEARERVAFARAAWDRV